MDPTPITCEFRDRLATMDEQARYGVSTILEGRIDLSYWNGEKWGSYRIVKEVIMTKESDKKLHRKVVEHDLWDAFQDVMKEGQVTIEDDNGNTITEPVFAIARYPIVFTEE